jgi:hypothetical protein
MSYSTRTIALRNERFKLLTWLVKTYGKKVEVDHGVWAHPWADHHYYDDHVEVKLRTIELSFMRKTEHQWNWLWFKLSEFKHSSVRDIRAIEGKYNIEELALKIASTGVNQEEAEQCVNLIKEWLGRQINNFSWKGFSIYAPS